MKFTDALVDAWQETVRRAKDRPALVDPHGDVLLSFADIEEKACEFESKAKTFQPGSVIAVQIGNHKHWPAIFIACLRKQLVVLPLEQSISDQQRAAALKICRASALVSATGPRIFPDI